MSDTCPECGAKSYVGDEGETRHVGVRYPDQDGYVCQMNQIAALRNERDELKARLNSCIGALKDCRAALPSGYEDTCMEVDMVLAYAEGHCGERIK